LPLHFGANDVQGTVMREAIFQARARPAGTEQKIGELVRFVREAGRIPSSATRSTTSSEGRVGTVA
jgi:2-iminoacetate synthase ThiH